MSLPLTQELLLIALDEETGKRSKTDTIDYGLAGAALIEMAMAGKVDVIDKKIQVLDPTPGGDPVIDELLAEAAAKPRKPDAFIMKYYRKMSQKVGQQLAAAGILSEETKHHLGFIPSQRYVEADGGAEAEIRARLNAAVLRGAQPDDRTAALVALIHATELTKQAFPGQSPRALKPRIKELAEGDWGADAVRRAVSDVRAAVIAGIAAATVAATSS